jgi:WD40 repeat protein
MLRGLPLALVALGLFTAAGRGQPEARKDQHGDPLPDGAIARLGTLRGRHDGPVTFAAMLPDTKSVLSVSSGVVRVWEFPSGKLLRSFGETPPDDPKGIRPPNRGGPVVVALSPDGKTLALTTQSTEIRLFDVATGKALASIKPQAGFRPVTALAFAPDGQQLASFDYDNTVRIWDWAKGKEVRKFGGPGANSLIIGANAALVFSPDGKRLATALLERDKNTVVNSLKIWDPATGVEQCSILVGQGRTGILPVFSPDGKTLACATSGGIGTFDAATGKAVNIWKDKQTAAQMLVYSQDGTKLYCRTPGDRQVREVDPATGKELRKLGQPQRVPGGSNAPAGMTLSSDGGMLVLAGVDNIVQCFDLATGKEVGQLAGHVAPVVAVQFSADGKHLLTGAGDGSLGKWDAATGKDAGRLMNANQVLYSLLSRDAQVIAYHQINQLGLNLISAATGKETGRIVPPELDYYPATLLSPDGKLLAVRWRQQQRVELYDTATARVVHSVKVNTGQPGRGGVVNGPVTIAPQTLLFSPDGKTLASYADPTTLGLWDTATGRRVGSVPMPDRNPIQNGAFSPDGRCLALDMNDGTVAVYELATGQVRQVLSKKAAGPANAAYAPYGQIPGSRVAFAPDGRTLAQAGLDRVLRVWDVDTGKELATFKGHAGAVGAVAYAPDGKSLATASADTTALVWDVSGVKRPEVPPKALARADLDAHWEALLKGDATRAFAAIRAMTTSPAEALALVKEQIKPAPPIDLKHAAELIEQLGSDTFKVRQKATADLLKLGDRVVPVIDKALAAMPPLETKRRLEDLREKLAGVVLQGEMLRVYRAVEVLERIGTAEARQALQALADGAPGAFVTRTAQTALGRLGKG